MAFPAFSETAIQTYTWRDAKGNTATNRFYIDFSATDEGNGGGFALALKNAIAAITWSALQSAHGLYNAFGTAQYGAHNALGAYETIEQKLVFVLQDSVGRLFRFRFPAPKIAIFLADKQTMDPANANIATLVGLLTAPDANGVQAVTRDGLPFSNCMGGYFAAVKLRRRVNVLTLTPPLTPEEPAE